jgi:hypothetical protein
MPLRIELLAVFQTDKYPATDFLIATAGCGRPLGAGVGEGCRDPQTRQSAREVGHGDGAVGDATPQFQWSAQELVGSSFQSALRLCELAWKVTLNIFRVFKGASILRPGR